MQKSLDDNEILMYSTHKEGKSVVAERLTKSLKEKIYKKLITDDSKSCLGYLNKSFDKYNNTYHRSIHKNLLMLIILL